eukprot:4692150-Pyramimonas_sp.AAC.1
MVTAVYDIRNSRTIISNISSLRTHPANTAQRIAGEREPRVPTPPNPTSPLPTSPLARLRVQIRGPEGRGPTVKTDSEDAREACKPLKGR